MWESILSGLMNNKKRTGTNGGGIKYSFGRRAVYIIRQLLLLCKDHCTKGMLYDLSKDECERKNIRNDAVWISAKYMKEIQEIRRTSNIINRKIVAEPNERGDDAEVERALVNMGYL